MNANSAPASPRIAELDGLRGFAIVSVVCLHCFYTPGTAASPAYRHFQSLFRLGWTGVDLFFVLSGFLIGGILLNRRSASNYFLVFYARRFFRIIPVYYVWIAAYILLVAIFGSTLRAHTNSGVSSPLGWGIYRYFLFLQNIWFGNHAGLSTWWFGPAWSLAVEEQFYLVTPLLIRFLPERRLVVTLALICLCAPLLRTTIYLVEQPVAWHAVTLTLCRADSLALGMLCALFWRREHFRIWLAAHLRGLYVLFFVLLAGIGALWYWGHNPLTLLPVTIGFTWIALFFSVVLLLALVHPSGPLAACARWRWLRELGRVSYCVYLIHFAVLYVGFGLVFRAIPHINDLKSIALAILCALIAYAIGVVSWHYFESPMLRVGHSFSYLNSRP